MDYSAEENEKWTPPDTRSKGKNLADHLRLDDVMDILGIGKTSVLNRVKQGYLHPVRAPKPGEPPRKGSSCLLFNPVEVAGEIDRVEAERAKAPGRLSNRPKIDQQSKLKSQDVKENSLATVKVMASRQFVGNVSALMSDGKKCAEAVKLFRSGKSMLDIIETLEIDFETSKYFWQSYLECQPSWVLSPKDLARVRSILDWREDPPTVEGFNQALNKCMTEAPERASLMSTKESAAIDAALAKIEPSEEDE